MNPVIDRAIAENPTGYLRKPSIPRVTSTNSLTRSELLKALDVAQATNQQDHALLCVLGLNGLRVGEACGLDVIDLGRVGGYRTVMVHREKGNRPGIVPLAPRTSWAIDLIVGSRTDGPLFRRRVGERMNRQSANRIVQRTVKSAGITGKRISPHSFRHGFITLILDTGVGVREVQNSICYADSRIVSYYDLGKDSLSRHATHMVSAFVEGT